MIQLKIHLEKTTSLYKNLNRRGFIDENFGSFLVWAKHKPSIGELIKINDYSVNDGDFKIFLENKNKPIILRITDLCTHHMRLPTDKNGIDVMHLKCYEDSTVNWF